jgi:PhnB protein
LASTSVQFWKEKIMKLSAYLGFDGNCAEAFRFYEECLGGKNLWIMTMGESPMADKIPAESHGKVMHARITVGDSTLMGGDSPNSPYQAMKGFCVSIGVEEAAEADRIFAALAEHGHIQMPIQETFWAVRFGMVTDRFGTPWMINCEKPM